jgi:RNA recognition motif-containing protein
MEEKDEREGEGWQTNARAKGKSNAFLQYLDKTTTSFFISNFPEEATSSDLWQLFLKCGRFSEVYISKKLDNRGRRFGFVKFKEVNEIESLSESLRMRVSAVAMKTQVRMMCPNQMLMVTLPCIPNMW